MIKRYCDACGREIAENRQTFNPLIHLVDDPENLAGKYVDCELNPVSGRHIEFDLCLKCYNRIMGKAVKEFKAISDEAGGLV